MGVKTIARAALSRVLQRFGYSLVETRRNSLGDTASTVMLAEHLRALFPATGIDLVIDVGANKGQYYDFIRQDVGFTGPVLSFEPNPALATMLRARAAAEDPVWTVFDCALGRTESEITLKVMTGPGWSSLLHKKEKSLTDRADTFALAHEVPVRVRALDTVLAEVPHHGAATPYLKVDAQGFDLEVLKGATETLTRTRALQTELELLTLYEGAPSYDSVLGFLREQQYEITGVFPVWRDSLLRIGEMDTVLRNMRAGR